jgi:hypothetical protein
MKGDKNGQSHGAAGVPLDRTDRSSSLNKCCPFLMPPTIAMHYYLDAIAEFSRKHADVD